MIKSTHLSSVLRRTVYIYSLYFVIVSNSVGYFKSNSEIGNSYHHADVGVFEVFTFKRNLILIEFVVVAKFMV